MNDKELFNRYLSKMESIHDEDFNNLNEDLKNGQNSYMRMKMKGSSFFNDEWIRKIEDCIYELGQIVNNPLEVTSTEGNLTPIELAKKINYESIQHLASHTQYIKDVDEEGNVVPAKILSQFHKEELHTYENKFIATFIRRLVLFVEKRYDFIKSNVNFDTKDILYVKNKSIVDGQEVEIETKVTVKKANEDTESKMGREYVERVELMRRYVNYFYSSPFMKELKTEKNVRKPILQTNIIRKNPYYRKCYETFLFIENFSSLGVEFALDEHYQDFNEKERKALNYILTSNLLSLESTERSKVYKKSKKVYKPKLLSSIDDEIFTYGDLLKGPIEYVRVDNKYTEYLLKNISKDAPIHPNKVEKEYYKDELDHKRNVKKHIKEVDLLLRRIRREISKYEKIFEELIAKRNIEEAKEAAKKLEELRKQEHNILEKKRKEIIAAAHIDKAELKAEEQAKEQAKIEAAEKKIKEAAEKARKDIKDAEEAIKAEEQPKVEEPEVVEESVKEEPKVEEPVVVEEEPKQEQAKVEEPAPVVEPAPEPQPEPESQPEPEPLAEEAPKAEEVKVEEPKAEEEPVEEKKPATKKKAPAKKSSSKKAPAKKPAAKKSPAKKAEPKVEELAKEEKPVEVIKPEPVLEEQPIVKEEPKAVEEVKVEEQPAKEEKAPVVEDKPKTPKKPVKTTKSSGKTGENEKPKAKKPAKKPAKKSAEKPAPKAPKVEEQKSILEKIPGRFIVKSNRGYVVSKTEFSDIKSKARVFDDFNDARRYKTMFGGKVIKL